MLLVKLVQQKAIFLLVLFLLISISALASNSTVAYQIEAILDSDMRNVQGEAKITYFNAENNPISSIILLTDCQELGKLEINQIKSLNGVPISYQPYKSNKISPPLKDRILYSLFLNTPLNPKESITFSVRFKIKNIQKNNDLLIFADNILNTGICWYPRVITLEGKEWESLKPDAPNYKVTVKLPADIMPITSGEMETHNISGDVSTFSYQGDKIRGFSLIAARGLQTITGVVNEIEIKSYFTKEERSWGVRMASLAHEILDFYLKKFGFFPYKRIHLVAALEVGSESVPLDEILLLPRSFKDMVQKWGFNFSLNFTRWLVAHLLAQQYWGLCIAESPSYPQWITSALSFYSDREYLHSLNLSSSIYYNYMDYYLEAAQRGIDTRLMQPLGHLARRRYDWKNILARGKGLFIINMLEYILGQEKMHNISKEILQKFSYSVISTEEFIQLCNSVSEKPLDWFFHQWLNTSKRLDYAVGEIKSSYSEGKVISKIEVLQKADARMPMPIKVTLSNGDQISRQLKGIKEKEELVITNNHPVYRVELDPEQLLPDINYANNYKIVASAAKQEPLFPIDDYFEIGELSFSKNFRPHNIFFQDDFHLQVRNKQATSQGLGIVVLVQKTGWRRMGKRSIFITFNPYETKLIRDYYLLPDIKGKIKIMVSFYKVDDSQEFRTRQFKKASDLTNGYVLYLK